MDFFDSLESGRILNRYSNDIYTIDCYLPKSINSLLSTFIMTVQIYAIIIITSPVNF
jgi:hypothetical protein